MSDQPEPPRKMTWTTYTKGETELWVCGENSIVFDGPDRKANADLFIRAQSMGELVNAASDFARYIEDSAKAVFDSGDWSWTADWKRLAPDEYRLHANLRTILAKIEGKGK